MLDADYYIHTGITKENHFNNITMKVFHNRPKNITEMLDHTIARYPEKEALADESGNRLSYRRMGELIDNMAYQLVYRHNVQKGDRVGLLLSNTVEFCISVFAVAQVGAVTVPLNTRQQAGEILFMLNDSKPVLLILEDSLWHIIDSIKPDIHYVRDIFTTGKDRYEGARDFKELIEVKSPARFTRPAEEEDAVFIMYTSGTTGLPKGAMGTHMGIIHSCINYIKVLKTNMRDRTLLVIPLFHVTGLIGQLMHMLMAGGAVVLMRSYKTSTMLQMMERERITFLFTVPTIYVLMLMNQDLDRYDLSSWRIAAYGGAPMSLDTIKELEFRFFNLMLHNAYGATETSSPATIMIAGETANRPASVGLPVPVGELNIVDSEGRPLGAGEVGELWIKGPMVIPRYWNNPEANRKEFSGEFWLSGDMAKIDEDGFVYILDRKKDMINRGGEKIFSIEVENVLYSHPKVMEASVVGVPDSVFGEQVKAVIVVKPGMALTEEEVRSYVALKLADYKVPKYVSFMEELPRNPGGKVIKSGLK